LMFPRADWLTGRSRSSTPVIRSSGCRADWPVAVEYPGYPVIRLRRIQPDLRACHAGTLRRCDQE
jgi:hypothetical protein